MKKKGLKKGISPHLLIGAHMSIAGGLEKALYAGESIGCTCVQIFTHSNRQWGIPKITAEAIDLFSEAREKTGISEIVVHASYLINVASSNALVQKRSITELKSELVRCEELQIPYLVMHPGSGLENTPQEALDLVAFAINTIFKEVPHHHTTLLVENMAGQGSTIGSSIDQLAYMLDNVHDQHRIGTCIDMCHAFAAGYTLNTEDGYEAFWKEFKEKVGLGRLKAFHLNDSLGACGSHLDRHADIGQGKIGLEAFKKIMHEPKFAHIPKILETPYTSITDHEKNLNVLRELAL